MNFEQPQRQPLIALVLAGIKITRLVMGAIWPIFIGVLFGKKKTNPYFWLAIFTAILLFVCIRAILEFMRFTFQVRSEQLIVSQGILNKKSSVIPLANIQAVHLEQTILHSLTRTYRVLIDTAGTEKAEVVIYALGMEKAVALKDLILSHSEPQQTNAVVSGTTPAFQKIISLSLKDLAKYSLTANHIETLVLFLVFMVSFIDDLEPILKTDAFGLAEKYGEVVQYTWQLFLGLGVLLLLFAVVASYIRTSIRFFRFYMGVKSGGFNIKWGLIEVKQKMIPFRKIQLISWHANFLRRLLGIATVQLKITGEDEVNKKQRILIPLTKAEQVAVILPFYQADLPASTATVHTIDRRFWYRRMLVMALPISLVLMACGYWWFDGYGLWLGLWGIYFSVTSYFYQRHFSFWVNAQALQLYKGVWGRESIVLNWRNIQFVTITASMYQQRKALATLNLHTAGGKVVIPYLTQLQAEHIADYALFQIESEQINWQ